VDLGLAGKRYVVTGASRGLGLASATALLDEGAEVSCIAGSLVTVDGGLLRSPW
jgi:3-oxoacyl-[acyl-carrier protein] reductase